MEEQYSRNLTLRLWHCIGRINGVEGLRILFHKKEPLLQISQFLGISGFRNGPSRLLLPMSLV